MVLLGLGTTWGCTRWLHREDFVFELSDKKSDEASESTVLKPAGEPAQYWLIGFKDRHLEREYLADLVDANSDRLLVCSFLCLVVFDALVMRKGVEIGTQLFDRQGRVILDPGKQSFQAVQAAWRRCPPAAASGRARY